MQSWENRDDCMVVDRTWLTQVSNVLLIRDPAEVVASYRRSCAHVAPDDLGLLQQRELYTDLVCASSPAPVVDAADFLRNPATYLEWLCDRLGVPFPPAMLSWPAGPRDSDGVWAPYWYGTVLASTGFGPYRGGHVDLDNADAAVARACRPAYDQLADLRVRLLPAGRIEPGSVK